MNRYLLILINLANHWLVVENPQSGFGVFHSRGFQSPEGKRGMDYPPLLFPLSFVI
jgi:hypothetical protein